MPGTTVGGVAAVSSAGCVIWLPSFQGSSHNRCSFRCFVQTECQDFRLCITKNLQLPEGLVDLVLGLGALHGDNGAVF